MTSALQPQVVGHVSETIHSQLWKCIDSRLERGDTLVRHQDFQRALEADYAGITGQRVNRTVRRALANSVVTINRSSPERYVAAGLQNSARRAFQSACTKLRWAPTQIQHSGSMVIARFKSHNRVRELLSEVGLRPSTIDADACVRHAVEVASGKREPLTHHDLSEPFGPSEPELAVLTQEARATGSSYRSDDLEPSNDSASAEEGEPLSKEERRRGALIGRVEMRIAGTTRIVARKIMPSPDDSGKYLLAQRNAKTGELEPLKRQDAVRPVGRDIDGVWREL